MFCRGLAERPWGGGTKAETKHEEESEQQRKALQRIGEVAGKLEEMQMLSAQMELKARGESF